MHETLKVLLPIIAAHVVVLVVIVLVIKRLLLSDTMHAVSRINQVEAEVRKKEQEIRKEIAEHENELDVKRAEAEEEVRRQREAAEKEVEALKEQVVAESRRDGDRIVQDAKKNAAKLQQQIDVEIQDRVAQYSGEVFKLVFSEKMNEALDQQFIDELLDALEELDTGSITVDTQDAEFTAGHPLAPEQRARLEKLLAEKFGAEIRVEEKVQEDLLAGLVIKVGSLEIDGSLRNRYEEAVEEVKKEVKA